MTMSEATKFMQANVKALTSDESGGDGWVCRCHNDKHCYPGNAISFRPSCSHPTNGYDGEYGDCSSNDIVCKNLH